MLAVAARSAAGASVVPSPPPPAPPPPEWGPLCQDGEYVDGASTAACVVLLAAGDTIVFGTCGVEGAACLQDVVPPFDSTVSLKRVSDNTVVSTNDDAGLVLCPDAPLCSHASYTTNTTDYYQISHGCDRWLTQRAVTWAPSPPPTPPQSPPPAPAGWLACPNAQPILANVYEINPINAQFLGNCSVYLFATQIATFSMCPDEGATCDGDPYFALEEYATGDFYDSQNQLMANDDTCGPTFGSIPNPCPRMMVTAPADGWYLLHQGCYGTTGPLDCGGTPIISLGPKPYANRTSVTPALPGALAPPAVVVPQPYVVPDIPTFKQTWPESTCPAVAGYVVYTPLELVTENNLTATQDLLDYAQGEVIILKAKLAQEDSKNARPWELIVGLAVGLFFAGVCTALCCCWLWPIVFVPCFALLLRRRRKEAEDEEAGKAAATAQYTFDSSDDEDMDRQAATPSPMRLQRLKAEAEEARLAHEFNAEAELRSIAVAGGTAADDASQPGARAASDAPVLTPEERAALLKRAKAALAEAEKTLCSKLAAPSSESSFGAYGGADASPGRAPTQRSLAALAPATPAALLQLCSTPPRTEEAINAIVAGGVLYIEDADCAVAALNACGPYFASGALLGRAMASHMVESLDGIVIRLMHGAIGTHLDTPRVCRMACAVACALASRPRGMPRPAPDATLAQLGWAVSAAMRAHLRLRSMQTAGIGALVSLHLHRASAATPYGEETAETAVLDVAAWQAATALAPILRAVRGAAVGGSTRARSTTAPTAADCAAVIGGALISAAAMRWAASAQADAKKEAAALQNAVEALAVAPGFLTAVNSVSVMTSTKQLVAPDAPSVLPSDTAAALKAAVAAIMTAALAQAQQEQ